MSRNVSWILSSLLVFTLILAACGAEEPAPEPAAQEAPAAEADAASESEAEVEATAEPAEEENSEEADAEADTAEGDAEVAGGMRTFTIATDQSQASYMVDEEFFGGALGKFGIEAGEYDIVGTTPGVSGEMQIDLAAGIIGENTFMVDLSGLTSDQNRRDNWVQNQDPAFSTYPTATFVATGIENAPADYQEGSEANFQLVGDLTVREQIVPITFDVTATLDGNTISGVGVADTKISDFGINPPNFANTLTVQDEFKIQIEFVATES